MKKSLALLVVASALFIIMAVGFSLSVTPATRAAPPIRPTPTPGIASPQDLMAEALSPSDGLPDLVVKSITVDQPARVGITATIRVILMNQGEVDLEPSNNFYMDLYIDPASPPEPGRPGEPGDFYAGLQGYLFRVGVEVPVTFEYVFNRTKTYDIYAQVDTDGDVVESDETNNVGGPAHIQVRTSTVVIDVNHEDFQSGFSNMDVSSPVGLVPLSGLYEEPFDTPVRVPFDDPLAGPDIYNPDFGVSDLSAEVNQAAPVIARDPAGTLFIAWEDGRNGEVTNRDIYFSRSTDNGTTWSHDLRVNRDPTGRHVNQRAPTIAYAAIDHTLYLAWQDARNGDYDIWFARSTDGGLTWVEPASNPISDDLTGADQMRPSLAVNDAGTLFIVWQDRRNGNDDIYFSYSEDGGDTWGDNVLVTDQPASTSQAQRSPAIIAVDDLVYVTWEDDRNTLHGDEADIYFTWGHYCSEGCVNYTFDLDRRLNDDQTSFAQRDPTIMSSRPRFVITRTEVFTPGSIYCSPPITTEVAFTATYKGVAIHFAWQDYRNDNDPDIYYAWTFEDTFRLQSVVSSHPELGCPPSDPFEIIIPSPFGLGYPIYGNVRVNGISPPIPNSCYEPPYGSGGVPCAPPIDSSLPGDRAKKVWSIAGSIQADPAFSPGPPDQDIVYILWSDRRNFDSWKSDIYVARPARPESTSPDYLVTENLIVNDNNKLLRYLQEDRYLSGAPASVRKFRPAGTYSNQGMPYVVWDDDRRSDPLAGYALERNVFFARPGSPPSPGVFMSRIFQANDDTHWNLLEWWGATPTCTKIFFQTRTGNTPWPDATWSEWTGPVYDPVEAMWVYPSPGEIVDDAQNLYPMAHYFQYRFWITSCDNTWKPASTGQRVPQAWVSKVTIHYSPELYPALLPVILKGGADAPPSPGATATPTRVPGPGPTPVIPNDTYYAQHQWNLDHIRLPQAWSLAVGNPYTTVAVVDTGVDDGHPDLVGRVVRGFDFINGDTDPSDDQGHGTHVAGIIGATTNNGQGVASVAWNTKILSVKVLNQDGEGPVSAIANGITYAADHGAKIINLSLGATTSSATLDSAVQYARGKGALLVAAAGNSYEEGNPIIYPAACNNVLAVAASDDQDQHASYSETGSYVDLAAPGGDPSDETDTEPRHWIQSTYWRGSPYGGYPAVGYMPLAGTSQAAPHVAGLACLIWSANGGLTVSQVESILTSTAIDLGTAGRDDVFGHGRVDALAAVQQAMGGLAGLAESRPEDGEIQQSSLATDVPFVPGQVLVKFASESASEERASVLRSVAANVIGEMPGIGWHMLQVSPGHERETIEQLRADPLVTFAEPDYIMSAIQ